MAGVKWTQSEIKKLRLLHEKRQPHLTDMELARSLSGKFGKSVESIRWQLRQFERPVSVAGPPKILLMDIETAPKEAYVWGTRKQWISPQNIIKDWSMLSWSAKWLFSPDVMGEVVKPKEAVARHDLSIMSGIWELMNSADIVVTQNGDMFDFKKLNTRLIINGYPRPMFYKSVDTYKILIKDFDFTYNSLDYVNSVLGIGRKIKTDFSLWVECVHGNQKALDRMLEYNKQDVFVLEELYLKIRPWIVGHPNMNLFSVGKTKVCPTCGDSELHWDGKYMTPLGLYQGFRCQRCGAIGRSTKKQFKLKGAEVS